MYFPIVYRKPDDPPASGGEGTAPETPADQENPTSEGGETPPEGETQEVKWENWIADQSEDVQEAYEDHTLGLNTALKRERESNKDLTKQLRELSAQAEEGSDLKASLDKLATEKEAADDRITFYERAQKAGVSNFSLAWLVVQDDPQSYLDRHGEVDFARLKENNPELFPAPRTVKTPPGNAGSGSGADPTPGIDMNAAIRAGASGRVEGP